MRGFVSRRREPPTHSLGRAERVLQFKPAASVERPAKKLNQNYPSKEPVSRGRFGQDAKLSPRRLSERSFSQKMDAAGRREPECFAVE